MGFWNTLLGTRDINPDLTRVLTQVDGQQPIEAGLCFRIWIHSDDSAHEGVVLKDFSGTSFSWESSVVADSDWTQFGRFERELIGIEMRFSRETEDGEIRTKLRLGDDRVIMEMTLVGNIRLAYVNCVKAEQPETFRFVREWMRQRILPEIRAAKTLRDAESSRLRAEEDAKRQEYRRKYLS